ncbi:syntaxin-12-like [Onthophagus taurus]|uniref:syntaxin-12-like n=1 Tax=Onthophagus taurus TaxID=166361 RepID=UPI0039BE8A44
MKKVASLTRKKSELFKEKEYENLTKAIDSGIRKITKNVASMRKVLNKIGTSKDTSKLIKELNTIEHGTNELMTKTINNMDDLTALTTRYQSLKRHRKTQQLNFDFMSILKNFEMLQESIVHKVKGYVKIVPSETHSSRLQQNQPFMFQPQLEHQQKEQQQHKQQEPHQHKQQEPHQQKEQEPHQQKEQQHKQEELKHQYVQVTKKKSVKLEDIQAENEQLRKLLSEVLNISDVCKEYEARIGLRGTVISETESEPQQATDSARHEPHVQEVHVHQLKFLTKKYILIVTGAVILVIIICILIYVFV